MMLSGVALDFAKAVKLLSVLQKPNFLSSDLSQYRFSEQSSSERQTAWRIAFWNWAGVSLSSPTAPSSISARSTAVSHCPFLHPKILLPGDPPHCAVRRSSAARNNV